jgi:hypothetical protein
VDLDADVLGAVAADRVRDQRPANGTRHPWMPNNNGMAPGRSRAEPGPGAQRLRCRRRERLGVPPLDRTLRDRPAPSGTQSPSETESPSETTVEPTRSPQTSADTPASTRAPTSTERPTSTRTPTSAGASQLADDHTPRPRLRPSRQPRPPRPRLLARRLPPSPRGWEPSAGPCSPSLLSHWLAAGCSGGRARGRPGTPRPPRSRPRSQTATGTQLPSVLTAEDSASGPCRGHRSGPPWSTSCVAWTCWPSAHPTTSDETGPDRSATCSRSWSPPWKPRTKRWQPGATGGSCGRGSTRQRGCCRQCWPASRNQRHLQVTSPGRQRPSG